MTERPINKEEANSIIHDEVDRYKAMPYDDLVRTVDNDVHTVRLNAQLNGDD